MKATTQRFLFRDSLAILSLTAIVVVLFAVTLFLFRSFEARRADLAKLWSDKGLLALKSNQPMQAVTAYRTALSYAPGERNDELMLAGALGQAGHVDESFNYFTNLWEAQPGDGYVNLELARLAAKQQNTQEAVNFYRAAIYGTWESDAIEHRRETRLELARYLIQQHQMVQAKTEVLVAVGNAPDIPDLDAMLARLLEQVNDPSDALTLYQKAIRSQPGNAGSLSAAARLAYTLGKYTLARTLLERAVGEDMNDRQSSALLAKTDRILQLMPSENLPVRLRVSRILTARAIAKKRLDDCLAANSSPDGDWKDIAGRWTDGDATARASELLNDPDRQKAVLQLIYDTEIAAGRQCGAPTGDDALLVLLTRPGLPAESPSEEINHR